MNLIFKLFVKFDSLVFSKFMNYDSYRKLHESLGFPIIRIKFFMENGYWPSLSRPETFNEYLVSKKLFDRSEPLPIIADKIDAREYVKNKLGKEILIPLVREINSIKDVDSLILEKNTIIKAAHASGLNIIIRDPSAFSLSEIKKEIKTWFDFDYRYQLLLWFTREMRRRVIVEELITSNDGEIPKDYKFFVVKGKVEFIQVDNDRFSQHNRTLYDINWNQLDVKYKYKKGYSVDKPVKLNEMISIALKLAEDFDFMRVDLYLVDGKIYFGELTPYPSAGYAKFDPNDLDIELGKKLNKLN